MRDAFQKRETLFRFNDNSIVHFAASYYAMDFLKKNGVMDAQFLIEPLGLDFIKNVINGPEVDFSAENRQNLILYNPAKKSRIMKKLLNRFTEHTFIPLKGFSPQQLVDLMKKSKLYVDFGKFPGPERLPKETAVCGCCILTSFRGAAAFYDDVCIPDEYKFKRFNLKDINNRIIDILDNYDRHIDNFQKYRSMVYLLESNFKKQIDATFKKENHIYHR